MKLSNSHSSRFRTLLLVGVLAPWACASGRTIGDDEGLDADGTFGDGAGTGGAGTGGSSTGGAGVGTGGVATGGTSTGGSSTGGVSTGGASTGGSSTGGASTGGSSTGGASTGGSSTGGASTGGDSGTGGAGTGGDSGTGGAGTGGDSGTGGAGTGGPVGTIDIPSSGWHTVDGNPSSTTSVEIAWDEAGITFHFVVADTTLWADTINPRWQDDGVEIYLDLGNNKTGAYDGNDFQITAPYSASTSTAAGIGNATWASIVVVNTTISGGYAIDVTIPWTALHTDSSILGSTIGFDLAINDDKDGGTTRDGQRWYFGSNVNNWDKPNTWGTLTLTEE